MKRILSIAIIVMMIVPGFGLLVVGQGEYDGTAKGPTPILDSGDMETTFGHGRLSRDYQDLSSWRGLADENVSVSYLIVTTSSFVNAAIPTAQWKTEKGLNSAIVTVEDIEANYNGQDNAQKIHNYLRDFRAANPSFKWLLLLGDTQFIPARHLWTNASYIDWYITNSAPSDFYYAALDSSWNLDGDGTWGEAGEVDWTPDIYVGRIPVDNVNQATFNLARSLKYEKEPYVGDWMNKALLASGLYDVPNIIGNYSTRMDHGYYEWWQDNGKEAIDVVQSHIPSSMNLVTLHDYNVSASGNPPKYWGGNWSISKDELDRNTFVPKFNAGQSIIATASHAWVNSDPPLNLEYYSHGVISYEGNGSEVPNTPEWDNKYKEFYYWTDARDATNGDMLPFWYASACLVGNFTQISGVPEETFEVFFKNDLGGVIGLVAATHGDYRGEQNNFSVSDGDTWLMKNYFDLFFNKGEFKPGKTLYDSKIAYREHLKNDLGYTNQIMDAGFARDSLFVYNLLGEPEVSVWTDRPKDMVGHLPNKVFTGSQDFDILVTDAVSGAPIKDATVALWGDTVYSSARTGADGKAAIHTDAVAPETVAVTITAHNYDHWTGNFPIEWRPSDLMINTANLSFSKDLAKVGDSVDINANVYNIGESVATNAVVRFYDGDPAAGGSSIGEKTIASLAVNKSETVTVQTQAKEGKNLFCVIVDPDIAIDEVDEFNNKACKQMEGTSKDLVIWTEYITFVNSIQSSDGTPMVGNNTTVKVKVQIENKGTTDVTIAYVRLFDGNPDVDGERIGITDHRVDDIPVGEFGSVTIDWNVSAPGIHNIYAILDPNDVIKEFDENNNQASAKVYSDLPPRFDPIDDIELEEDDPSGDGFKAFCLFTLVDDPDNIYDELFATVSSNTNPNINLTITSDCVDIVPKENFFGFSIVEITVSDPVFDVTRSFKVTIDPANDAPNVTNPGTVLAQEGTVFELQIEATDPDGDPLTYSDNSALFQIDTTSGSIQFTPSREQGGSHVVEIVVTDGVLETRITFILKVDVKNSPPILEINEDKWVFEVGKAKRYNFKVSDQDGDPLTITDDFTWAEVSQDKYLAMTAKKDWVGTYVVHITVSDGFDNVTKSVTIEIKERTSNGLDNGIGNMFYLLLLVITIVIVAVIVLVATRRSGKVEGKSKAYDSLYGADEMVREKERKRSEEEEWQRRREERRRERDDRHKDEEEPTEDEDHGAAFTACPKCGTDKIKEMSAGEWMCMKCGKIFS